VDEDDDVVVSDDGRRLRPVKSLLRALDVLETLAASERPLTLAEIATRTGFSRTAAYNVVATYEIRGLVRRDAHHRYVLGWGLFALGEQARYRSDLSDAARPSVDDLAEQTGETVLLGVLDQDSVIYVEKAESRRSVRMVEAPGRRLPLHESVTGLVLLAHATPAFRDRYIDGIGDGAASERLRETTATIRSSGFATSVQDLDPDLTSASVPVHGPLGDPIAALTVAGPASRLTRARIEEFVPQILGAATAMSKALGSRSHP
jgi:DNA-binding IclR family transcriptional regulator